MKQLMILSFARVKAEDIFSEQSKNNVLQGIRDIRTHLIPEYMIIDIPKPPYYAISTTEYQLQFIAKGVGFEGKSWLCFDVRYCDLLLDEEINQMGFDSLINGFKDIFFPTLVTNVNEMPYQDFYSRIPTNENYFIVDMNYDGDYFDVDLVISDVKRLLLI